ncbi:MAG: NYN domain-containing protein, partial [Chloroflexi bacterium]|nr:NYN domain-containing protein [Chloroflexota bacterium]
KSTLEKLRCTGGGPRFIRRGKAVYYAIDDLDRPHLKWVDLWALSQSLLRPGQQLVAVNYFSAYATWMPARYKRHRTYVAALKTKGVSIHLANFKIKQQKCYTCSATWKSREEKETDVAIAAHLVADALCDRFDIGILITADSDLKPAIANVRAKFSRELMCRRTLEVYRELEAAPAAAAPPAAPRGP